MYNPWFEPQLKLNRMEMKIIILMFFEDKNLVNCQFLGLEWAWGILDDPLLNLRNVQVRLSSGFGLLDNSCVFNQQSSFI